MADVDLAVVQGQHAQRPGAVEGPADVLQHRLFRVVRLPRRRHQIDRVLVAVNVDGNRQKIRIGANGVGQRLLVEDERRGRLDLELNGGADLVALGRRQVVVLVAGRVPAQGGSALDGARRQDDLGGQQEGAEEAQAELADQLGRLGRRAERQPLAQLARVAAADGGEVRADFLLGQPVAVVGDDDEAARGVESNVDARPVVRLVPLDLAADAGVVGVLDQLPDADLLAGIAGGSASTFNRPGRCKVNRWRSVIRPSPEEEFTAENAESAEERHEE